MDDNPEQQLTETIKHCEKTAPNLEKENESLLQKQKSTTDTTCDSDRSVQKQSPLIDAVTKQLMDIDFALESNQQQSKLTIEPYLTTQSDLPISTDRPMIQSDDNQMKDAQVTINQQVKPSNDDNGQNEVKLSPTLPEPQALTNGTLPDDAYLHLLSVMGIQECLLRNRLVCPLWNELVLERCHSQKSLKVFETFDCFWNYGEWLLKYEKTEDTSLILKSIGDDLLFEGIGIDHEQFVKSLHQDDDESDIPQDVLTRKKKLEASKVLTTLFPKIQELVLIPEDNTLIDNEHLLQFYAGKLTSLTVTCPEAWYESSVSNLRAINFPKLKVLNTFNFSPAEEQLLSLLPQLDSLTLGIAQISLETLLRTGTQLRELNIGRIESVYTGPVEEFSKRPPINSKLRKFTFVYSEYESQVLEFISQNMTSLECLKVDLLFDPDNVYHLHSLSPYLAPLTQLHSLTLQARLSFFLLDDNQHAEIQPQPAVRQLRLLLWNYESLPPESRDLFSRSLFTAFPNAEHVLIAFVGYEDEDAEDRLVYDSLGNADTLAAFEAFAGKHPNVVQLFRSKDMSRFTAFPNVVSPLLGHRRQAYEEYIHEEELFGMPLCKLTESLVTRQGEDAPNLKAILRQADRLSAMSNLLQLLQSKTFSFTVQMVKKMMLFMIRCAFNFGPSQGALFSVTTKCILSLLDCCVVDVHDSDGAKPFLDLEEVNAFHYLKLMLLLVEHSMNQQFNDKELLFQLYQRMVKLLKKFDLLKDGEQLDEQKVFKILLKLANHYQTQQLNVLDNEELLLHIHNLIDDQLQMFESEERLDSVTRTLVRSKNPLYRVEMARALTRCCKSTDGYFNLLSGEADSDSSEGDSSDSDSSDSDSGDSSDSSDSDSSDSSSGESEPEP